MDKAGVAFGRESGHGRSARCRLLEKGRNRPNKLFRLFVGKHMPGFFDLNNLGGGNLYFELLRVDRRNERVTLPPYEQALAH